MENLNKEMEKLIYLNINQTPEEKVLTLEVNIFSTITNTSFLNKYDKKSYEELVEIIKTHNNVLIPSLPIFRFSEEGKNDDTAKVFSFSLGVVNNDYEHGKYELLTVDELKQYLNKDVWILLYTLSDESYDNTPFKWRIIILNKKSTKIEGNATEIEIISDVEKFKHVFKISDEIKNKYIKRWIDVGLIDDSKTDEEKYHLTTYLTIAEDILNKENDENKEYHTVVYPIIVRLNEKLFLRNQSIHQIVDEIKKEYKLYDKDKYADFELKFIETFVDIYTKKANIVEHKHLNALFDALKTGKPNDQTKLIAGLSQLKKCGSDVYNDINTDWLFSNYYRKYDNTLTKEEKKKKNEEVYQWFIEKNIETIGGKVDNIDKLLNYISEFYDNKNPYPLMLFSETFNVEDLYKNDIDLTNKYLTAINHPIILELKNIYEKYKDDYIVNIIPMTVEYKYHIAKIHQLIDILINYYKLKDFIKIDSNKCHHIANQIFNEIKYDFSKFDANVYMEKYVKANKYETVKEFEILFVQQFLQFMNIKPQIKLF